MKTGMMFLVVLGMVAGLNLNAAQAGNGFQGKIQKVLAGEFDPYVVGDACVVQMKTRTGKLIAFVTDYEDCVNNAEDFKRGRGLTVAVEIAEKITSSRALRVLSGQFKNTVFYAVPAGTLENGLADPK